MMSLILHGLVIPAASIKHARSRRGSCLLPVQAVVPARQLPAGRAKCHANLARSRLGCLIAIAIMWGGVVWGGVVWEVVMGYGTMGAARDGWAAGLTMRQPMMLAWE